MTTWPVVAATGHRPQHLPPDARPWVRDQLYGVAAQLAAQHGTTTAVSGMALGVDTWWAWAAVDTGLVLHAYVPFPQQADVWPAAARNEWRQLLNIAAQVVHVGDLDDAPSGGRRGHAVRLLHARNDRMLAVASAVVAVWDQRRHPLPPEGQRPSGSGTLNAVWKALGRRLPLIHIDPDARTVTWPADDRTEALW